MLATGEAGRDGDVAIVAVAAAAAIGSMIARDVDRTWVVAALIGVLWPRQPASRRVVWLGVAVLLAASAHASSSWASLTAPVPSQVTGRAQLISDPRPAGAGTRVDLDHAGRRYEATAYGGPARLLAERQAGETVQIRGQAASVDHVAHPWFVARHVAGRLTVTSVSSPEPAVGALSVANRLRSWLSHGIAAAGLRGDVASLVSGITIGDDRHQSAAVTADFRVAGLTHLLAVSGQNVALVLGLALPFLRRRRPSVAVTCALLILFEFALLTRWEPSVLRAVAMSGIAVVATASGRAASPIRLLALAATGLLLADPLLVHSIGFRLSVAATAAIILLAPSIERRVRGPRPFAVALSVTLAAQIGVLPLQIAVFGIPSPVSVPANLAAGWAAGALMAWGVGAGLVAGLVPSLAMFVHVPSSLLANWLLGVARQAAVGATALAALAPGAHTPTSEPILLGYGAELWRTGDTVVLVVEPVDTDGLLTGLAAAGVGHVDLVVLRHGGVRGDRWWDEVHQRLGAAVVVGPARSSGTAAGSTPWTVVGADARWELDGLTVAASPSGSGLDVTVNLDSGGRRGDERR